MKLESFSKEELIFWLRTHTFNCGNEDKIISDLLHEKSNKLYEKLTKTMDKYLEASKEYCELLKPYEGKHFREIPSDIISYGAGLESKIKKLKATMDKIESEYSEILNEYKRRNRMK